jgi:hypothetical protein
MYQILHPWNAPDRHKVNSHEAYFLKSVFGEGLAARELRQN